MTITSLYGTAQLTLRVAEDAVIYTTRYPVPSADPAALVRRALEQPHGAPPLSAALQTRRAGMVVLAVADITRPVPYPTFLPDVLARIEAAGVPRNDILLLIATGMHRASTPEERRRIFGPAIVDTYRILDHDAHDARQLARVPGTTLPIFINKHFVEAGFRMVCGLVEPHFMAGFSGARKMVCPGLAAFDAIRRFHSYEFLAHPRSTTGTLTGNPCHEEALDVARCVGVDFVLDVVINRERRIVQAFAGALDAAHTAACTLVKACACPTVVRPADVVVTSSGGHPLDATFYQCVKGFVGCLPAVKRGGTIIAFGSCDEGIGSDDYAGIMRAYGHRWREFLTAIQQPATFTKDQWQMQFHTRALAHVGQERLHFVTHALTPAQLATLGVTAHPVEGAPFVAHALQALIDKHVTPGATLAVLPEGPYCAPLLVDSGSSDLITPINTTA